VETISFFSTFCYKFSFDGISLLFVLLTVFLVPICILASWSHFNYCYKEFLFLLFLIEGILINFFLVSDLFFFYVFFEAILLPLFVIIGSFGFRQRRIHATFQLFFFTLIGSFFMLFAIVYLFLSFGTVDFFSLSIFDIPFKLQLLLWACFFISLSVKVPLFPFHIWLPEAHVEAPTIGSVILAGVLLKMGTYGLLKILLPLFPFGHWYFGIIVQILSFISIVYISVVTLCQVDLKKLVAYSSVAHMGYATIAVFILSEEALKSSFFLMLNHGLVSSALFLLVGILYDRYKTRVLYYYSCLNKLMPFFGWFVFMLFLANASFPGTSSFFSEFLLIYSFVDYNIYLCFYNCLGLLFSGIYSFWLYNRTFNGIFIDKFLLLYSDLCLREFLYLFPFVVLVFFYSFYGFFFFGVFDFSILYLVENSPFFEFN